MPTKRRAKTNRRQLDLFPRFDARQLPLYPHTAAATSVSPAPPRDARDRCTGCGSSARRCELGRAGGAIKCCPDCSHACTCLEPGDVGERFEGIGGPVDERIFEAEHES